MLRGNPTEVLPEVMKEWGVTKLCFEHDTEPYALKRDAAVRQMAEQAGIQVGSPSSMIECMRSVVVLVTIILQNFQEHTPVRTTHIGVQWNVAGRQPRGPHIVRFGGAE